MYFDSLFDRKGRSSSWRSRAESLMDVSLDVGMGELDVWMCPSIQMM